MWLEFGPDLVIRRHRDSDIPALVEHADNPKIAAQMRDRFPHPYTAETGRAWLAMVRESQPERAFAIARRDPPSGKGRLMGGIGLMPQVDVHRIDAELGYWLGETFWGQGIVTQAVRAFVGWAFVEYPELERIHASVFSSNPASARVLEKVGFEFEGRLRHSVIKNGALLDQLMYARLRADL